jgi:hypothetical protein
MTHHTPRRTVRIGTPLWDAFLAKHGKRRASARLRELMLLDLEAEGPPTQDQGPHARRPKTHSNAPKG